MIRLFVSLGLLTSSLLPAAPPAYRVLVSTDLGGDPDDIQSLYRLVHYSDILKVEGLVSSPGPGSQNSADRIREWIRRIDVELLRRGGHPSLMTETELLTVIRQGQTTPGAPSPTRRTEGSDWIIRRAHAGSAPLWVLVWGSITDVAQALHDDPSIAPKIRIYFIGSSNTTADPASRDWLYENMAKWPSLWWIENGVMPRRSRDTFRGVYEGGEQSGEWGNREFVARNVRGSRAGNLFPLAASPAGTLKEGDSPSMLYLLSPVLGGTGNPDDPAAESWGGRFRRPEPDRFPNYFTDLDAPAAECQQTVSKWRTAFLGDWKKRWAWYPRDTAPAAGAIGPHPGNPRYFLFRGRPTVLITSAEHYGAVLNLDFDYSRYLATLEKDRLNLTRIFPAGTYWEVEGAFRIVRNTLAPPPGRVITPWRKAGQRYDLTAWNDAYFDRLRAFVAEAGRRGVVVEISLFCPYYEENLWQISPLNPRNNVNGIGSGLARTDVYALKDKAVTAVQDAMVRKIAAELRDFDNVYYEIANEPYIGGITLAWQRHISVVIADADAAQGARHMIAQNIANGSRKIDDPDPLVSLFNFHYSRPPESIAMNRDLNKAIGCNETGFDGTADATYRIQGWDFLIAGGALYNNLDYSFTAGHEDGTFEYPATQPGGGSVALRRQLRIMRDFLDGFNLLKMAPGPVKSSAPARCLAEPGRQYAVYLHHGSVKKDARPRYQVEPGEKTSSVTLDLPAGRYRANWVDTRTGAALKPETFRHRGGEKALQSPTYTEDIALRVAAL